MPPCDFQRLLHETFGGSGSPGLLAFYRRCATYLYRQYRKRMHNLSGFLRYWLHPRREKRRLFQALWQNDRNAHPLDPLIGLHGFTVSPFHYVTGKVQINGKLYDAECIVQTDLPAGRKIVVTGHNLNRLQVKPIPAESGAEGHPAWRAA